MSRSRTRTPRPSLRGATVRESLCDALREGPCTAKDLSRAVGIPERDVPEHLEHLARSLRARGEELVVEPSRCLECDFVPRRHPMKRPAHCPSCRGRRLALPRFSVSPGAGSRSGGRNREQRDS